MWVGDSNDPDLERKVLTGEDGSEDNLDAGIC